MVKTNHTMPKSFPWLALATIVLIVICQFLWYAAPRDGTKPASDDTLKAMLRLRDNPTTITEADVRELIGRDVAHNNRQRSIAGISCAGFDVLLVYFLLGFPRRPNFCKKNVTR